MHFIFVKCSFITPPSERTYVQLLSALKVGYKGYTRKNTLRGDLRANVVLFGLSESSFGPCFASGLRFIII